MSRPPISNALVFIGLAVTLVGCVPSFECLRHTERTQSWPEFMDEATVSSRVEDGVSRLLNRNLSVACGQYDLEYLVLSGHRPAVPALQLFGQDEPITVTRRLFSAVVSLL